MKRILFLVCLVMLLGSFVSAEYAAAAERFVNNNNGTVTDTDTQTGLMPRTIVIDIAAAGNPAGGCRLLMS